MKLYASIVMNLLWVVLVVLVITVLVVKLRPKREGYGFVNGSLGRYTRGYNQCLSECEREDSSKFLGSLYCAQYCDTKYTGLARQGGPSYPLSEPVVSVSADGTTDEPRVDQCYHMCGDSLLGQKCRQWCDCDKQVDDKCRIDCAYSRFDEQDCMKMCTAKNSVNCVTNGWQWK